MYDRLRRFGISMPPENSSAVQQLDFFSQPRTLPTAYDQRAYGLHWPEPISNLVIP
jgi:hypothetical protein